MRKTENFTVTDEGRDHNKTFILTEWPASRAEAWAIRALLALGAANVEVPDGVLNDGMAGLAAIGLKKLFALPYSAAGPLLDELMECVTVMPDARRPQVKRALVEEDIEEIRTRLTLKWQVLKLHIDFTIAGGLSNLGGKTPAAAKSSPTRTSHKQSE